MAARFGLAVLYGLVIFLSAFLLFQVQPVIGKLILPWFGGSAAVWTTCMLFFQAVLLLGYLYSHWIVRFLPPRGQSLLHATLLAASLLLLPLGADPDWRPTGAENPTLRILGLLGASIGLPYFVLSTTGPLIQAWFARERPGALPYRLFALSNLGSLLALLAYPVAVEPLLPLRWQSWTWSALFVLFAGLCGLLAWRGSGSAPRPAGHHAEQAAPGIAMHLAWIALAACPSVLLLADTSFLTENIAPVPLLWVLPLALYLLSFILCFESRFWYRRRLFLPLLAAGLGALAYVPTLGINALPLPAATALNLAAFFVACMVCHGELARLQPDASHLTGYYLMLAVGGAMGGLLVGIVAPTTFNSDYDYSVALALTALVVPAVVIGRHRFAAPWRRRLSWGLALLVAGSVVAIRVEDHLDELRGSLFAARNFYGNLRVRPGGEGKDAFRTLMHGRIIHGRQFADPARQDEPTTYYSRGSGAGLAIAARGGQGPLRLGVVGLGVGTLAAYGRPGDELHFYDIDPLVVDVARASFTYLARTRAHWEVVLGDARLTMERESPQRFDVLLVDAFSGDAIPIHLLTREAFAHYRRHLKADGVLAVHISNRFLNLAPVVAAAARELGLEARTVENPGDDDALVFSSTWVLVGGGPGFFDRPPLRDRSLPIEVPPGFRPWADDYSSIFSVLK
ncbi:MAG: fused MFS/spermidine synthase [Rhodocyclaceae bacterium]|nr:fused MFS/spermidine synthase [Rhodocyclaceae bacterium]